MSNEQLEALYGAPAAYSDHKPGDSIRYRDDAGQELTGTIMYVIAPARPGPGRPAQPLTYVLEEVDRLTGLPALVYQSQIIE